MRRLIARLRAMKPQDPRYDDTFFELLRDVIHHVADEETVLLPAAERLLHDRLSDLGAQMTRRRPQLVAPHLGEIVVNTARAMPAATVMTVGAILAGAVYVARRAGNRHRDQPTRHLGRPTDFRERLVDLHQPTLDARHLTHMA